MHALGRDELMWSKKRRQDINYYLLLIFECYITMVWLGGLGMLDLRSTGHGFETLNPSLSAVECNHGQVVYTQVPLSPSSIIWYQPMGGDALRLGR